MVHFSDWHARFQYVPKADLYICTGDMLRNFPVKPDIHAGVFDWRIDKDREAEEQAKGVAKIRGRKFLGSPDAPVVVVRGNHDFVDLAPVFGGDVTELAANEVVEIAGVTVTGHRGIPYIQGDWSDEESRADLKDRMRAMPVADIYVTHYPPAGILDSLIPDDCLMGTGWRGEHLGLEGMADHLLYRGRKALHCFGHVHECGGRTTRHGDVTFSNAACSHNVIDWSPA